MKRSLSAILSVIMLFTALYLPVSSFADDIYQNNNLSRVSVHDPSLFRDRDGKYYVVGSHLAMGESSDLVNWTDKGFSMDGKNYLSTADKTWKDTLAEPLEWTTRYQLAVPEKYDPDNLEYNVWANDVIYNETMGKYCLYGACSVWGATSSDIWLCVSDNIDGPYEYVDTFIYTGITNPELERRNNINNNYYDEDGSLHADPVIKALDYHYSNVPELIDSGYIVEKNLNMTIPGRKYKWFNIWGAYDCGWGAFPNAIDPTVYTDKNGEMWLVYGSYSGGCFVQKLNNETGLPDYDYMNSTDGYDVYFGKRISNTNEGTEGTGEGPYIVYDSVSDYYYLFLTYGGLAADGGYNIREYRSKNPDGPFEDAAGNLATDSKNTGLKLDANYRFECQKTAFLSGGHSSCILDSDGSLYQAYHTRFTADNGWGHQLRIHKMARTRDGWAVLLPYEYQGEKDVSLTSDEIVGAYQMINSDNITHRKASGDSEWSTIIAPTQYVHLNFDGTVTGAKKYTSSVTNSNISSQSVTGVWKLTDGGAYAEFNIGGVKYNGVFTKQKDESAQGKEVVVFTAKGDDNSSLWGAQHLEHKYEQTLEHATFSADGSIANKCIFCGEIEPDSDVTSIAAIKSVSLSANSFTYSGRSFTPTVKAVDSDGKTISSENYTVSYSANKNVGKATAEITFLGNYSGVKKLYFKINPKNTTFSKPTAIKAGFKVKIKKYTTQTTGYQIQYSTDKKFKSNTKTLTLSNKTTAKTVSKLKKGKTYYVRIRTYKTVGKVKYYSAWSSAKSVKTKKK